ncbi:sensor histidine kinase [Dyadobacter sp. 3J3]|uniref:sensor histidine kinase n=1 Tax=Dyadobacter sp. 3J3 TaxID=2606600 RepID=UPI001356DB4D|nr:histidine kinase [Dyadobacter sp. 3J3]
MISEKLINYFLTPELRNKLHPEYDQVRTIVSGTIVATTLLLILPVPMFFFPPTLIGYYILAGLGICTLYSLKWYGIYWPPLILGLLATYVVIINDTLETGAIDSPAVTTLYLLLLTGFWFNRRIGLVMIGLNILAIIYIFYSVPEADGQNLYAVVSHIVLTIFFGAFFWFVQEQHDAARLQIREQQHIRIDLLDRAVKDRTQQLSTMRQNLASDFHDETGNMLSAITRQAAILKLKLKDQPAVLSIVDNIIMNSDQLYASSRDFLWSVNNNSDDPQELFAYLTSFGQVFYNQFDIAFSVKSTVNSLIESAHLQAFASRHIIFIFKEAMTNVAKHSGAREVLLEMAVFQEYVSISLQDDGSWKEPLEGQPHNGLHNMEKRSKENNFRFKVYGSSQGTRLQIDAPVHFTLVE